MLFSPFLSLRSTTSCAVLCYHKTAQLVVESYQYFLLPQNSTTQHNFQRFLPQNSTTCGRFYHKLCCFVLFSTPTCVFSTTSCAVLWSMRIGFCCFPQTVSTTTCGRIGSRSTTTCAPFYHNLCFSQFFSFSFLPQLVLVRPQLVLDRPQLVLGKPQVVLSYHKLW